MKKIIGLLFLAIITLGARAEDTIDYVQISDLKAFATYLSIYLEDGQTHACGSSPSSRFQSNTEGNQHYTAFLLSAFSTRTGVSLKYSCSGNTALVTGVRIR